MTKFVLSLQQAWQGLEYALRTQRNVRIHCIAIVCVSLFSLILSFTILEWLILLLTMGMVLGAELFNTSLEVVVDLVSPRHHPLAKAAKDTAAAAVLVAAGLAFMVGMGLAAPRFLSWIQYSDRPGFLFLLHGWFVLGLLVSTTLPLARVSWEFLGKRNHWWPNPWSTGFIALLSLPALYFFYYGYSGYGNSSVVILLVGWFLLGYRICRFTKDRWRSWWMGGFLGLLLVLLVGGSLEMGVG